MRSASPSVEAPPALGAPADPLSAIVDKAVVRSVDRRFEALSATRRKEIAAELRASILALFETAEQPAAQASPASEPVPVLEGPGARADDVLQEPASLDPSVEERLRSSLRTLFSGMSDHQSINERVLDLVRLAACAETRDAIRGAATVKHEKIEVLERRIGKLQTALEMTRAALAQTASRPDVDPGLPSIYRTVQGLAECDALREVKHEMLVQIYEANLELQNRVG